MGKGGYTRRFLVFILPVREGFRLPLPETRTEYQAIKNKRPLVFFSPIANVENERGLLAPLNEIVGMAIWKVHTNTLIRKIQILLKDSGKSEHEKFIETCQMIDKARKDKTLSDPLCDTFCKLFEKEILNFFCQEIKKIINKNKSEWLTCLENIYRWLIEPRIKPSPLRDLLIDLKKVAQDCAEKNRWPVPSGVKQLNDLLNHLDWIEDENLPKILSDCRKVIAERLKFSYLTRDPFTFFLYRNFYPILSSAKGATFDVICREISGASEFALEKRKKTRNTLTNLHVWLLELKNDISVEDLNKKGKTLGIFPNKPPDGVYRLRIILNKLPINLPATDESQVLLIKIFFQISEILFEKVVFSKMRSFRDPEVKALYQRLHAQIQRLCAVLSEPDKEVFCAIHQTDESEEETLLRLAVPKGYSILSNPEKMGDELEKVLKLFASAANEVVSHEQPSCAHC